MICEANEDLPRAIKHRENEVRLIQRLHEISRGRPQQFSVQRLYGYDDLSDRLDLLAALYHDHGNLAHAISTLQASKQLCAKHGCKFDAEDLLQEYLEEEKNSQAKRHGTRTYG